MAVCYWNMVVCLSNGGLTMLTVDHALHDGSEISAGGGEVH